MGKLRLLALSSLIVFSNITIHSIDTGSTPKQITSLVMENGHLQIRIGNFETACFGTAGNPAPLKAAPFILIDADDAPATVGLIYGAFYSGSSVFIEGDDGSCVDIAGNPGGSDFYTPITKFRVVD